MQVRDHVVLAAACGFVVGAIEGAVAASAAHWAPALVSGALLGLAGLVFGVVQAGVAVLGRRLYERSGFGDWLSARMSADPTAERGPVVGFHAGVVAALLSLGAVVAAMWVVLSILESVGDPELHRFLVITAMVGLAGVGAVLAAVLLVGLRKIAGYVDDRWGLPRPRGRATRFALFVALPSVALGSYVVLRHGARLGALVLAIYVALFPVLEMVVLGLWRWGRRGRLQELAVPRWLVPALAVVFAAIPFGVFAAAPAGAAATQRAELSGPALRALQRALDFDRDGAPGMLGGGDCAPSDPAIGPYALDVPGNGIDEDCSGADAEGDVALALRPPSWRSDDTPRQLKYQRKRYNLIWVVVDAIRADHCHVHGYKKPTTPYLSELGKSSWVFDRAYSQSSATMLSIPSMQSGLRPSSITWKKASGKLQLGEEHVTLAERLKKEGYRTGAVSGQYSIRKLSGMFQGFDDVMDTWLNGRRFPWYGRNAAVATTLALQWLERDDALATRDARPFYLMVYMADPHDPYSPHTEGFPSFGKGELARYDGEIAFTDRYVGMLIDYLRYRRPLLDDTIIVFTADHGEEFGEHGGKIHAYTCYEESVHVPLIVRIPGAAARRVDQPVALTDVVPTLLDALGLDEGGVSLDGASLALAAAGTATEQPIFCSVLSQKAKQGDFFRRSVRYRDQTLIENIVAGTYELYNTKDDPYEKRDMLRDSGGQPPPHLTQMLDASVTGNLLEMRLLK